MQIKYQLKRMASFEPQRHVQEVHTKSRPNPSFARTAHPVRSPAGLMGMAFLKAGL